MNRTCNIPLTRRAHYHCDTVANTVHAMCCYAKGFPIFRQHIIHICHLYSPTLLDISHHAVFDPLFNGWLLLSPPFAYNCVAVWISTTHSIAYEAPTLYYALFHLELFSDNSDTFTFKRLPIPPRNIHGIKMAFPSRSRDHCFPQEPHTVCEALLFAHPANAHHYYHQTCKIAVAIFMAPRYACKQRRGQLYFMPPAGNDPAYADFQSATNPSQLQWHIAVFRTSVDFHAWSFWIVCTA